MMSRRPARKPNSLNGQSHDMPVSARLFLLVTYFAALLASAQAQERFAFVSVPPAVTTDKSLVELRLAIHNDGATDGTYEVSFYVDDFHPFLIIGSQKLEVGSGDWGLASVWWDPVFFPGNRVLLARVTSGDDVLVEKERPLRIVTSDTPSRPMFDGVWMDPGALLFGVYPSIRAATVQDVRDQVDAAHALGVNTLIITYAEYDILGWGPFYPSGIEELGTPLITFDAVGTILDQANERGMSVFVGIGRGPEYLTFFPQVDPVKLVEFTDLARRVGEELHELYGHYDSFYGWYISQEMNYFQGATVYYNAVCDVLRPLAPERPIMISPAGTPTITPALLAQSKIDIFNYQDAVGPGYVPYVYTYDPQQRINMLHDVYTEYRGWHEGSGKHFWINIETWQMNGPNYGNAYPADWERVATQIDIARQYGWMLTTYEYFGFLEDPASRLRLGGPRAQWLYRDYRKHLIDNAIIPTFKDSLFIH